MLVLTRKVGQSILLPELGIEIMVVRIAGEKVRIGIEAPADWRIVREELEAVNDTRPSESMPGRVL